ncbi:MAG TPA: DUF899 domain-containing protein [Tepidisphaeraceae bacterium]|nr:DUF899 domain-containing protein [Tepidisphaeraceae bacterium]
MATKTENAIRYPKVVDHAEWKKARDALLLQEKAATRARDALAAERRRLPMVKIDKPYTFTGPKGKLSLLDLFEGRRQLLLYHFMFAPPVPGWPDAGCVGCSMVADQFGNLAHFHARDTSLCLVSVAPLKNIERFKKRMGWSYPWYSSEGTDFNKDFGLTTDKGENYGLSVFIHDDDGNVYRTYFTDGRGVEALNIWTFLDLTPLGRQEEWEDSPLGGPRTKPFVWWRRHDEYGNQSAGQH